MKYIAFGNNTTIAVLLLMAGTTTACKKLIEIPATPPTAIAQAQQFSDSATTMTAIAGIYSYPANGSGNFTFNDGYLTQCTGLSSDEISSGSSNGASVLQFYNNGITPLSNYILTSLWSDPYTGLYPVNAALTGIAASSGLSASFKIQLTGELKVVRALYYFDLVNLFGGVPLITSIDYQAGASLPRSSVDSVYIQILKDLTDAQAALTVNYPSAGRARPNLYTVKAFLSKVYLYQKEWQAAYDAADTVIRSGLYSLEPNLNKVFLDGSQEAIWQLPANGIYTATREASNFVPSSSGTAPYYPLTTYLLNAFETGDQRLQDWVGTAVVNSGSGNQNVYYPYKYKNRAASSSTVEDFMIFRLGELYLIRAEAAAELGNAGGALADLNIVRARAGLSPSTAASPADILSAIMHERQIELFCEWGNRWLDLKRTGTINTVLGAEKTGWQPTDALYPLPVTQLQADPQLTQNPGYN